MLATQLNQTVHTFQSKDGTPIRLRPVRIEDASEIVEAAKSIIDKGVFIQKEKVRSVIEEQQFIRDMNENGHMYIVAEVNGVVRGIARVLRGDLNMKRHTGLFRTWLHEDAQGKGIGKQIMKYTLDWCQSEGLHKLCLTVFSTNDIALKLYQRAGFIIEGVQKDQVIFNTQFADEIWMAYFFKKEGEIR